MTLDLLLDIGSWILLMAGSFFCLVGGIGLLRLPDFYSRTHAGSLTDTLGAALILLGLTLQATTWLVLVKLILVQVFMFLTAPTAAHALVRAAFSHGLRPKLANQDFMDAWQEDNLVDATQQQREVLPSE